MTHAFGLVIHQASINWESTYTGGSDIRGIRDGFGAKAGVFSALLARKGVIGDKTSLDGKYGLYNVIWRGDSDPAKVTADLGKKFEGPNVSFKPWPCCRNIHGFIEAALHLVKKHDIKPDDVAEIIAVSGGGRKGYYQELDKRRAPQTSTDARYSLPFILGIAIARGDVLLEDFTPEGRNNATALELAQKVTYRFDEQYKRPGIEIGLVEIVGKGDKVYRKKVPFAYGHPENPIAKEDLFKKFRDCAAYSAKPLSKQRVEQVIEKIDKLEKVKDMREVVKLVA
jgi:2-methylcitrate dehydratase PrpD